MLFMLSSVYSAVQRGDHTQIQSLLAYKLLLSNGCGTCKNNIRGHSFFWSGTREFTNIIIVLKKISKQV